MTVLKDFSRTVGTEPVEVVPDLWHMIHAGTTQSTGGLVHLAIRNVGKSTIWLSRTGPAAVRQPGSYPLAPGDLEEHHAEAIPKEALSAVAAGSEGMLTVGLRYLPKAFTTAAERQATP